MCVISRQTNRIVEKPLFCSIFVIFVSWETADKYVLPFMKIKNIYAILIRTRASSISMKIGMIGLLEVKHDHHL